MSRAVILGGTGAIGRAAAARLLAAGWQVDVTGRDPAHVPSALLAAGASFTPLDRSDHAGLSTLLASGADLLVDCVCFTAEDARSLLPLLGDVGSAVMLSSKGVYVDSEGRHSNSVDHPVFDGPIRESQPTMAPGDGDHRSRERYGANKVAAEQVLLGSGYPVTVIRASKLHGNGASPPREWIFVKRVLDHRPALLLARRGSGIDHPTGSVNLAALIERVAERPGKRILNSADPDAPTVLEIARAVARRLGCEWDEILLPDDAPPALGDSPWNAPTPIILDTTASLELGYVPVGDYATTVVGEIEWLSDIAIRTPDGARLPGDGNDWFARFTDYEAEDAYLAARR